MLFSGALAVVSGRRLEVSACVVQTRVGDTKEGRGKGRRRALVRCPGAQLSALRYLLVKHVKPSGACIRLCMLLH